MPATHTHTMYPMYVVYLALVSRYTTYIGYTPICGWLA
jgi:hypothetical protein